MTTPSIRRLSLTVKCLGGMFILGTTPFANCADVPFELHPALQLSWPGEQGRQYQLYKSTDLSDWQPLSSAIPGNGGVNTFAVETDTQPQGSFRLAQLDEPLTNVFVGLQHVWWNPAFMAKTQTGLNFFNLRLQSDSISPADMVTAIYAFHTPSQAFRLSSYTVLPGVGVYNNPYFARDNTNAVVILQTNGQQMVEGKSYSMYADGRELYMDLSLGHAISFSIQPVSGNFEMTFSGPNGEVIDDFLMSAPVLTGEYAVFHPGRYTLRLSPYRSSPPFVSFSFRNANRRVLAPISDGSTISVSLANGRDYAKYWVDLLTNQILSVNFVGFSGSGSVRLTLLNSNSEIEISTLSNLKFQPSAAGRYYLFIDNNRGLNCTTTSVVGVTPTNPGPPVAAALARQSGS